ncbi:hypothetical protein HPA02_29980 [Bisbaumannia pacifica]|uniref:Uncharacterized protein n=1 Tax=Bisbaumannia pacifica TaxID=77098 RepID=A0A510XDV6_9GAMM|nr:hypothetical protein HPA02_29980 [Halomonas pacifica]
MQGTQGGEGFDQGGREGGQRILHNETPFVTVKDVTMVLAALHNKHPDRVVLGEAPCNRGARPAELSQWND